MNNNSTKVLLTRDPEADFEAAGARTEIRKIIELYIEAGDIRNTDLLKAVLHDHFRVVANHLMGAVDISLIAKEQYISLVREGKLGGDSRAFNILWMEVIENNASATVRLTGKALSFESFYHLVRNIEGQWQLVQDLPYATKN